MEKKIENTAFGLALENGNEEIIDLLLSNYSEIEKVGDENFLCEKPLYIWL